MNETETLDLGALFKRDDVKLPGGVTVELRNQQEFGVLDDFRLRSLIDRIQAAEQAATQSEEDAIKASELLHELATMIVVDCPEKIDDWACVAIFRFWTKRIADTEPADPSQKPRARRTTAGSSRGSKRSTAGTRKPGSTTRRGS